MRCGWNGAENRDRLVDGDIAWFFLMVIWLCVKGVVCLVGREKTRGGSIIK